MLRWLIAILILVNALAFAVLRGMLGPLSTFDSHEPNRASRQVHPESLKVRPLSAAEAADQAVVGAPAPTPPIQSSTLTQ
jgi:hypothetical protein